MRGFPCNTIDTPIDRYPIFWMECRRLDGVVGFYLYR